MRGLRVCTTPYTTVDQTAVDATTSPGHRGICHDLSRYDGRDCRVVYCRDKCQEMMGVRESARSEVFAMSGLLMLNQNMKVNGAAAGRARCMNRIRERGLLCTLPWSV